jgi:hypothetical protein
VTKYLRFHDLQERNIVRNRMTLRRWILREDFPPGIMLGPNTRAWPEDDVNLWLACRSPSSPQPAK